MASEKTTIWYLVTALSVGGAERTLVELANDLDRERFDVTIFTLFDRNPLASEVAEDVPIRTLGSGGRTKGEESEYVHRAEDPLEYVRIPLRFLRLMRAERPDVVQSFVLYDNAVARLTGVFCPGTTIVSGARGVRHIRNPLVRLLDRGTVPLADYVVSNSTAGADFYASRGVPAEATEVIYNGRDLDEYRDASGEGLRAELGIPRDAPIVGTVGRSVRRKGHFELLVAWPDIKNAHPDAHCLIVGGGPEHDALCERAATTAHNDSIHLLGSREDVPELLDVMDVFVFPSHYEGLPGALLEAMAAGLPIVATAVEGNDELIASGKTGLLIPPKNPWAICHAADALLDDREFAARLGRAAQADVYDRFTLDAMVENFERFYEKII